MAKLTETVRKKLTRGVVEAPVMKQAASLNETSAAKIRAKASKVLGK